MPECAQLAQLLDQLDVLLGLPRLGEQANRVRRVRVDDHRPRPVADRRQAAQDRAQLGDVVGALAQVFADLALARAIADDHDAEPGGAGVRSARAVGPDVNRVCRGLALRGFPSRPGGLGRRRAGLGAGLGGRTWHEIYWLARRDRREVAGAGAIHARAGIGLINDLDATVGIFDQCRAIIDLGPHVGVT